VEKPAIYLIICFWRVFLKQSSLYLQLVEKLGNKKAGPGICLKLKVTGFEEQVSVGVTSGARTKR